MSDIDNDDDMPVPTGSLTHTAWSPHLRGSGRIRKFGEWVKVGRGRIETDSDGNPEAHVYTNAIVRGDTGYIRLTLAGKKPPPPTATAPPPKRPQAED